MENEYAKLRPVIAVLGQRGVGKTYLLMQLSIRVEKAVIFPKIWKEWEGLSEHIIRVGYGVIRREGFDPRKYLKRHNGACIIFDDLSVAIRSTSIQSIIDLISLSRHYGCQIIAAFPSPEIIPRKLFNLFEGFIVFRNNISPSKWREYLVDGRLAKWIASLSRRLRDHEFFFVARDGRVSKVHNGSIEDVESFITDLTIREEQRVEKRILTNKQYQHKITDKISELAMNVNLSYADIAERAGTTIETVSTIISRLRRRGINIPYRRLS